MFDDSLFIALCIGFRRGKIITAKNIQTPRNATKRPSAKINAEAKKALKIADKTDNTLSLFVISSDIILKFKQVENKRTT